MFHLHHQYDPIHVFQCLSGTWLLSLLSEMNITAASKHEFLDVMDGIIELFHTYRPNKRCYLEMYKKSIQVRTPHLQALAKGTCARHLHRE